MYQKEKRFASVEAIFMHHIVDGRLHSEEELALLYHLVGYFRPKNPKEKVSIASLLAYLSANSEHCRLFSDYLKQLLVGRNFGRMVADVGIWQDTGFFEELKKRTFAKILPNQPEKDTMEYVLNQVFYKHTDSEWVQCIPMEELTSLFSLLSFEDIFSKSSARTGAVNELLTAIGLLAQRMGGRSLESYIIRMVPEYTYLESPFLSLEEELERIQTHFRETGEALLPEDLSYKQFIILLNQCHQFVEKAFKNSSKYGITLKVSQGLSCIGQQLARIEILIRLLVAQNKEQKVENTLSVALKLIEYNCYKNDIRSFLRDSIQSVSYEITQHTATTGEKYITDGKKEYLKMLKASLGGGFIVGFLCIFKALLSKVDTSAFGYAFLYSMNYAVGFIAIYLLHYTLATKQPAMTATTIIRAIEKGLRKDNDTADKHSAFADLFARLFRSQFIAFIGNIVMAFPVALALVWGIDMLLGINIVGGYKWQTLLNDANPTQTPVIFHAAIAGVFLFLSGIISGNISNSYKHNRIYYRIAENPFLKRTFGTKKAKKLSKWMEKKWAGVASNFWFGVFMGTTASIGYFLGLNLDIRHITFVSGNIAMGAYGADFVLEPSIWFWCFTGLVVVGFVNFIVSFSLSLLLAFRSRNLKWTEIFPLNRAIWSYFKKHPMRFFFPPKYHKEHTNE